MGANVFWARVEGVGTLLCGTLGEVRRSGELIGGGVGVIRLMYYGRGASGQARAQCGRDPIRIEELTIEAGRHLYIAREVGEADAAGAVAWARRHRRGDGAWTILSERPQLTPSYHIAALIGGEWVRVKARNGRPPRA